MKAANERLMILLSKVPNEDIKPLYERHRVGPGKMVKDLLEEIRFDGSNTISSLFRGYEGVDYDEIVQDVAEKFGVEINKGDNEITIERKLLDEILNKYLSNNKVSLEDREKVAAIVNKYEKRFSVFLHLKGDDRVVSVGTIRNVLQGAGAGAVLEIIGAMTGRQLLPKAASSIGLAIPLLNVILIAWAIFDVAGPAFRKTVPTVIEIAILRIQVEGEEEPSTAQRG